MIDTLPLSPIVTDELEYRVNSLARRIANAAADGYFDRMGERGEELRREYLMCRYSFDCRLGIPGDKADYWAGIAVPA